MTLAAGPLVGPHSANQRSQPSVDRLDELAGELVQHGMTARLRTPAGRLPSLHVVNPAAPRLAEDVYVGRGRDGMWCFWWPWAERIVADGPASAASLIANVLRARG